MPLIPQQWFRFGSTHSCLCPLIGFRAIWHSGRFVESFLSIYNSVCVCVYCNARMSSFKLLYVSGFLIGFPCLFVICFNSIFLKSFKLFITQANIIQQKYKSIFWLKDCNLKIRLLMNRSTALLPPPFQSNSNIYLDFAQIFQCHSHLGRNQVKMFLTKRKCLIVGYK